MSPNSLSFVLGLGLLRALAVSANSSCSEFTGNSTTNPTGSLVSGSFADGRVLLYNGTYYAYATNHYGGQGINVPTATSTDFRTGWTELSTDALPTTGKWTLKDSTGDAQVWDPSVSYTNGQFVMYYAADIQGANGASPHCVGYATASNPVGPFTPSDDVFICPRPRDVGTGVISPSPVSSGGNNYLVYKYGSSFDSDNSSDIELVQLDETGTKIIDGPVSLYNSTNADFDAEGPAISISPDGTFFLFFVVGKFSLPNYAIHYVTSTKSIWGPYETKESVLMETGTVGQDDVYVLSPGGPTFVDAQHMLFMATVPNNSSCLADDPQIRNSRAVRLVYDGPSVTLA